MCKGGGAKKAEDGEQEFSDSASRSDSDRRQYGVASHVSTKTMHQKAACCISVATNDDEKQSRSQFPRCPDWISSDQAFLDSEIG